MGKIERKIQWITGGYGVVGIGYFAWSGGLFTVLNFLVAFVLVFVNFIYLDRLTKSVLQQNPEKAKWVILINLLRYPLIAVVLYAIVSWRHFQKVPVFAGLTAVVFALVLYPILGGGAQQDAS